MLQRSILIALLALSTVGCARKPVFFETGQAEFLPEDAQADRTVDQVARRLKVSPWASVVIVGITDIQGDTSVNQRLSEQRADYVRAELLEHGLDPERVTAVGIGEVEARRKRAIDRRVEFVYYRSAAPAPSRELLRDRFGR